MPFCKACNKKCYNSDYCFLHKKSKPMKRTRLRTKGKKARKWAKKRSEFLKDKQTHEGYYICEDCEGWFKNIDVDHIKSRGSRPDLVFDDENLQTLCRPCHIEKHG